MAIAQSIPYPLILKILFIYLQIIKINKILTL